MGIQIGNGNKIKNSNIAENINGVPVTNENKRFYDKHPWIAGIIISSVVAFIFLFSFWDNIVDLIERWF